MKKEKMLPEGSANTAKAVEKTNFSLIDENFLKSRIYTIRGVKVMLDADLAEIYGYSTKVFNRQVKNNIDRFPEEFRFQLNASDIKILRCNLHRKYKFNESIKPLCIHRAGHLHAYYGA